MRSEELSLTYLILIFLAITALSRNTVGRTSHYNLHYIWCIEALLKNSLRGIEPATVRDGEYSLWYHSKLLSVSYHRVPTTIVNFFYLNSMDLFWFFPTLFLLHRVTALFDRWELWLANSQLSLSRFPQCSVCLFIALVYALSSFPLTPLACVVQMVACPLCHARARSSILHMTHIFFQVFFYVY